MNDVRHFKVSDDDDGQRLDRWMKRHTPEVPFVLAQKLIRTGQIRIDGKRAKPDTRLSAGQEIRLPPVQYKEKQDGYRLRDEDAELMQRAVIYDDGEILAINKPSGVASQGGNKIERHIDGMLEALVNREGIKPRLVHRLDKDTSGVLLLARSAEMARKLGAMFAGRDMKKIYWAVTVGVPSPMQGDIRAALLKLETGADKDKMVIDEENGQRASTLYEVADFASSRAAFVAFMPRTGRTHQIRVHAAEMLGCPLLGDRKYGGADAIIEGPGVSGRLHLHAHSLSFRHPKTGKVMTLSAPLPDDMKRTFEAFGFDQKAAKGLFSDV
jgi:23S rRNA pseudouridine955/2504/2580 synthase